MIHCLHKCNVQTGIGKPDTFFTLFVQHKHSRALEIQSYWLVAVTIPNFAGNAVDEQMHETEPISSEKVRIRQATLQAELPVGSTFFTPQKKKPMVMTVIKDSAGPFKTGSSLTKKGKNSW